MNKKNKPGSFKRFRKNFISKFKQKHGYCRCEYCGCDLVEGRVPPTKNSLTLDHIVPLSKGGQLKNPLNIKISCLGCNQLKGNKVSI